VSGTVIWVTGLPSAGKSTLGRAVVERLRAAGRPAALLDGDAVRAALVPAPGFEPEGRAAFYATLGNLAVLLAAEGLAVVVAATAQRRAFRDAIRARVPRFLEVWVDTPAAACAARDPGGLGAAARAGAAPGLPGAGEPYEPPRAPEVVAKGGEDAAAVEAVVRLAARSAGPAAPEA
jgi:adenylylsulfate kinase